MTGNTRLTDPPLVDTDFFVAIGLFNVDGLSTFLTSLCSTLLGFNGDRLVFNILVWLQEIRLQNFIETRLVSVTWKIALDYCWRERSELTQSTLNVKLRIKIAQNLLHYIEHWDIDLLKFQLKTFNPYMLFYNGIRRSYSNGNDRTDK